MLQGFLRGFCFALAALVASGGLALAQTDDVFVVPRVPVTAQGVSASEAKRTAQDEGRRRAMDILLRRLTVEEDWIYLPNLRDVEPAVAGSPGPGGKSPVSINAAQLVALESGFVVYGEKSSSRTYRAFITYRFKPEGVRGVLRAARLPYSEAQTRTALVLPVLQTDSAVYLWEEKNPWMAAWKARPFTHELTPMTAPLGDLEDVQRIDARQALALDQASLSELAAHYSVSQVIVAHARLRQEAGADQLSVRLINGYRESGDAPAVDPLADIIDTSAPGLGADGPDVDGANAAGEVLGQAYLTEASGDFPTLAERAIERAIASYATDWKAKTLIDHGAEVNLESTAFFQSVGEWAQIRSALIETPLVGSVQVAALSRRGAEMRMRVFGDPSRLATAMESQGLTFWTETGDRWFIATPNTAPAYRGRAFLRASTNAPQASDAAAFEILPTDAGQAAFDALQEDPMTEEELIEDLVQQ